MHESVHRQLAAHREGFFEKNPGAEARSFYKLMAPFFHSAWAGAILDPVVPALRNTDGEEWAGFVRKAGVKDAGDLASTMAVVARFAKRPLTAAASGEAWSGKWPAAGPWEP